MSIHNVLCALPSALLRWEPKANLKKMSQSVDSHLANAKRSALSDGGVLGAPKIKRKLPPLMPGT